MWRYTVPALLGIGLLGCPSSLARTRASEPAPGTVCRIGPPSNPSPRQAARFGIQAGGGLQRGATFQALIPELHAIGFGWMRLNLNPGPRGYEGRFDFDEPGKAAAIEKARRNGFEILATLQIGDHVPTDEAWTNYVRAAVRRFHGDVHHWEIWNEPDLHAYFKGTPADYARLLRLARQTLAAEDSHARVVFGGLALTDSPSGFLEAVMHDQTNPPAKNFDIMAFHHYGRAATARLRMARVRSALKSIGRSDAPIWITEVGYGDAPPKAHVDPEAPLRGQQGQVEWARRMLLLLLDDLGAEKVFWFQAHDQLSDPQFGSFGLYSADGKTKLAACGIRDLISAR